MSLEEILRILNSRPSKMCEVSKVYVRALTSQKVYDFINKANHLEYYRGSNLEYYSDSINYMRISEEALRIISNKDSNDTLEAYLNF